MKVKNIMFSGVMAAILGATGANAAINVASQGYVDSKVGAVETNITNNYLSKTDAADTYATTQYVTQNITNVLGDETDGLVADVATAQAAADKAQGEVDDLETVVAGKANSATTLAGYGITDAYTKTEADEKFEEQAAATQKLTDAKAYTDAQIKELTDNLGGVGDDGEATGLTGTVAAQGVRIGALEDKVGTEAVANQIATALTTARGYADAVEAKLADYTKTSELDSTFATDAELDAVDAKFANYTTTEGLNTKLNEYATKQALETEVTARESAVKAVDDKLADYTKTTDLDAGFVSESEMTAFETANTAAINAKVAQSDYDTKVAALDAKDTELEGDISQLESDLANKITAPAACETQDCVLSINKATGTIAWVPLTEPVADYLNN